jgi:hypothetical protein
MRAILFLSMMLPAGSSVLSAQVDYYGRLGVTWTTKLVRDVVTTPIETRQSLAPTLFLGAAFPIAPLYRVGLEAALATSGYHSTEAGTQASLGTVRTASIMLDLEGPIWQTFRYRAGAGLIHYLPSKDEGIFLRGGSTEFLAGAGVDYRRSILSSWDLMTSLRYDFHRFSTSELEARGFTHKQGVQRLSASIGLARAHR